MRDTLTLITRWCGLLLALITGLHETHAQTPTTNMSFEQKVPGWMKEMIMPNLSTGEYALIHTGSDPGVSTIIVLLPKSQRGLIVFTKGDNGTQVWTKILAEAFDVGAEMLGRG